MSHMRRLVVSTLLAAIGIAGLAASVYADGRKVGTIGPPPRKDPERQTSAEGMPPLPLPATPLRRSEPKAEPTPPMFMGKLIYGDSQDYTPNPGDCDNLMRKARTGLGLWYGWKVVDMNEMVAAHKAGKSINLPLVYITGYEPFKLNDAQRGALRQYLVDGGTLVADATLGSPEFTKSFRAEVKQMFPDRSFDLLQLDHPVYRAFYKYTKVHYYDVEKGPGSVSEGPPEMFGMTLGTRTAIVFSPNDMSCGWDEFTAPKSSQRVPNAARGKAMIPEDAVRLGINLISAVAALRQVAETEAVTQEVVAPRQRPRQEFAIAQVRHQGDWNPDPNSSTQLLRALASESSLAVDFNLKQVDPSESKLAPYPFLYITGLRDPKFTDAEKAALRRHIQSGGFLFINNCSGYAAFDRSARSLVADLFPDQKLAPIPADSPLLKSFYTITEGRDRQGGTKRDIELEGITVKDRLVVVYSKNDMISHIKQVSDPFGNGYDADTCRKLAVNVISYALQN